MIKIVFTGTRIDERNKKPRSRAREREDIQTRKQTMDIYWFTKTIWWSGVLVSWGFCNQL